ncbi:hypothetical protein [Bradyrhizobium sp. Ash2021]|uniref:hypothetical protein n=1 Tax=Bradyrhizobium sp. Ash2021 TaxID=2954771 RepID=UPI0028152439|nr:hypothetical protein [Bradyrhizobium sp. Ash2021]WMT76213.1 hypothetical protein NL528_07520 [Bradyrhizobium sp. Ash2021]
MQARMPCVIAVLAASMLATAVPGEAAGTSVRARFSFDAVANCEKPAVQNYPVHAEGTGVLSTDRTATLDMNSNVEGRVRYNAKLGAKPTEAIGGSASLRVAGRHTLQAVRDYPNNSIVVYMTVIGNSCSLRIENRLKPGKRQYTFTGNLGVAYCSKPRIIHTECTPY